MSGDVFDRNMPVTYEPVRIALEQTSAGEIVALADFAIRNADGHLIDFDHPVVALTAGEQSIFLTWFMGKLAEYETATGLTRFVP